MSAPRGASGPGGGTRPARPAAPGRSWRLVRADTDAVPPSVRRFMARARQRRLRAVLPWAAAVGVLAVAALGVWTMYGTAVFGVREVTVVGTAVTTVAQVRAAAAVGTDTPLARVDVDAVRDRVQALPPVKRAVVSRDWPHGLLVEVVERSAVAAVPRGGVFLLLDADGVAYTTEPRAPGGLPLARLAAPAPGEINTRAALTVLAALTDDLREQLTEISVEAPARIRVLLRGGRTIVWGDETDSETKARVATALLNRKGTTIDVSAPEVVTIR